MSLSPTTRFTWPLFAILLLFATAVFAQTPDFNLITNPLRNENVPAGSTYQIVWVPSPATYPGPITLSLVGGQTQTSLSTIVIIAKGVDGAAGKYDWNVDKSLGGLPIYGLQMFWEADVSVFQYSFPFQIEGPVLTANFTSSSATASPTAATVSTTTASTESTGSTSQIVPAGDKSEGQSSGSVPLVVPVVLGVVLGLVAFGALGWFLWRRNKKRKERRAEMVPELGDGDKDKVGQFGSVGELSAHQRPVEVSGEGTRRVELE